MTFGRSITNRIKRGLTIRTSSLFESENSIQTPPRPTISLPLERQEYQDFESLAICVQGRTPSSWISLNSTPTSPTPSSSPSSLFQSYLSTPSSRASSSSRTSCDSREDGCFPPLNIKKKSSSSSDTTKSPRRGSSSSVTSSVYGPEGKLPPPIEDDEEIAKRIGKFRFSAAEYIQEIQGTPMILVDGKLYL
jgi:hypothetical protein